MRERRVLLTRVSGRWTRRLFHKASAIGLAFALSGGFGPQGGVAVWTPDRHGKPVDVLWQSPDPNTPRPDWLKAVPWFTCTTIFLTSGTSWTVPGDWNNANNSIECIGAGQSAAFGVQPGIVPSSGGTGGDYAKVVNQTASGSISIQVGVGGGGGAIATSGSSSWWNSTSTVQAAGGGSGDTTTGSTTHTGGNDGGFRLAGGGAAGPHGNGNPATSAGATGGSGDAGFGGAGGNPGDGGNGTEFDATHGSGGGGGSASAGNGGLYGGGGGTDGNSSAGNGANGLIVITYTPAGGTTPFIPVDFPNPRGAQGSIALRTFTASFPLELIGKDTFFTGPGCGPDYDWPNPRGYVGSVALRTWADSFKLTLIGKDQFFAAPGMGPNYDWPNPQLYRDRFGAAIRSWGETWSNRLANLLAGKDLFFGAAGMGPTYDWPNPRGYAYPIENRTFLQQLYRFAGLDKFFGAPGQPPAYDWPNPRGYSRSVALLSWTVNLLQGTLSLIAPPFYMTDWPVPRGYPWPTSLRGWLDTLKLNLLGQDFVPNGAGGANNYDWPVPRGYQWGVALRTWVAETKLNLLGQDTFFGAPGQPPTNLDQPIPPRGYAWPMSIRTWLEGVKLNLLCQDKFFGAPGEPPQNYDWPVPRGYAWPAELRTWLQNAYRFTGLDQFFGAPGEPPQNYDWPNPHGYAWPAELRTWLQNAYRFSGLDQFFGAPGEPPLFDWPNPRRITWPVWTWANALLQSTLSIVATPFAFYDWPVPRGYQYPTNLRTFLQQAYRFTGFDLFFGAPGQPPAYDWPNPLRAAWPVWTWTNNLLQSTLAVILLPFAMFDWPVPRGYLWPNSLRSWLEGVKLNLLGQDQFFGAPGEPPPNYDWPVPRGYPYPMALRTWLIPSRILTAFAGLVALFLGTPRKRYLVGTAQERTLIGTASIRAAVGTAAPRALVGGATKRTLVGKAVPGMSFCGDLQPALDADGEALTVGWDFGPILAPGVTLTGTPTITVLNASSSTVDDGNPQGRIESSPVLVPSNATKAANCQVNVLFGNGVAGAVYIGQCVCATSDGQNPSLWWRWPCKQPG